MRVVNLVRMTVLCFGLTLLGITAGCGGDKSAAVGTPKVQSLAVVQADPILEATESREGYDEIVENPFFDTMTQPLSTFSVDVDTASYSNVRRILREGNKPPRGAIRLEELVNYFPYDYKAPSGDTPFSVSTDITDCPWNDKHQLMRVALKGKSIDMRERQPCNLVFLVDVSGSMQYINKLPLVKTALNLLVDKLNPEDRIAIVVYAGASGLALESTPAKEVAKIIAALDRLEAGGSTNGGAGIQLAYQVATENFVDNGINRVILCTDGDFNIGVSSDSGLVDLIQSYAKKNVFLSVLGFGTGNVRDSTMERLADKGNGNYAYIDSQLEARKVLVEQMGGTLATIAKDVKIQVDFNPKHFASYRLLGYENRRLENQDFRDDQKDAGEIGAGHTVTAFYELVPAGQADSQLDIRPSEFVQAVPSAGSESSTMLTVNLRYKHPLEATSQEFQVRVNKDTIGQSPTSDFRFATSVLAYGMLLRESDYAGNANWDWVVSTAQENLGNDPTGLRAEFVQLAITARRIYQ